MKLRSGDRIRAIRADYLTKIAIDIGDPKDPTSTVILTPREAGRFLLKLAVEIAAVRGNRWRHQDEAYNYENDPAP